MRTSAFPPLAIEERTTPNPLQAEAIRSSSNAVLLIASPGAGKTRVIRARLAYLLNKGVAVSSVLVVTFTQHAAQQLKLRVGALAGSPIDGVRFGTFHSICAAMLREHAGLLSLPPSFVILPESEQLARLSSLMRQVGMTSTVSGQRKFAPPALSVSSVLKRIQCWKESGLQPHELHSDETEDDATRAARRLYPLYQRRLWERGELDYSDLTLATLRLFEQNPHVLRMYQQRYQHVLVDELQDTSAVQYEWLRRLSGKSASLFCAADDDQSIYGWRGAARDNVLRFKLDWPNTDVIRMAQSYRCSPHVLASALPLLKHTNSLLPKSPFTRQAPSHTARVLLRGFWDSTQEGAWIAEQLRNRALAGQPLSSMAVLVRSHEQAKTLLPHFAAAGVPVAMQPLGAVDKWWEAHDVHCAVQALRLVRSTADKEAARDLLRAWGGLSSEALATLQRFADDEQCSLLSAVARALQKGHVPAASAARLGVFFARFTHWQELARKGGLAVVLGVIASDHAKWCTDGGRSMRKLVSFASGCGSLQKLLAHSAFVQRGSAQTKMVPPAGDMRIPSNHADEAGAVSLLTIHRSKGLEWDTVFLPGWEQGTFPMIPSSGTDDEEWRLAYVALTRARFFAGITHASRRQMHGRWLQRTPSNFLNVLPSSSVASFAPNEVKPYYGGASAFRSANHALFASRSRRREKVLAVPARDTNVLQGPQMDDAKSAKGRSESPTKLVSTASEAAPEVEPREMEPLPSAIPSNNVVPSSPHVPFGVQPNHDGAETQYTSTQVNAAWQESQPDGLNAGNEYTFDWAACAAAGKGELSFDWAGLTRKQRELEFDWASFNWAEQSDTAPLMQTHATEFEFAWTHGNTDVSDINESQLDGVHGGKDTSNAKEAELEFTCRSHGRSNEDAPAAFDVSSTDAEEPALSSIWRNEPGGQQVLTFVWANPRRMARHLQVDEDQVVVHLPNPDAELEPVRPSKDAHHEAAGAATVLLDSLVAAVGDIAAAQHPSHDWL